MNNFELIKPHLLTAENLLIVGNSGTGKTRLINRIIQYIETQPDLVYVFITQNLVNHTGENSYGHLNGARFHIDNLLVHDDFDFKSPHTPQNTIIEFPYWTMDKSDKKYGILIDVLSDICKSYEKNNKLPILIADEMDTNVNTIVYLQTNRMSYSAKCIISALNENEIEGEFDDYEPKGNKYYPGITFHKISL